MGKGGAKLKGCRLKFWWPEAHEADGAGERAVERLGRIGRQIAGKDRRLGLAVEGLAADRFAFLRHADDAGKLLAFLADRRLAGGADRGERGDIDLGAGEFRPRRGCIDA